MCAVLGTVALPLVFGGGGSNSTGTAAPAWQTPLWLAFATVTSVYLLVLLPRFSQLLASQLWERVAAAHGTTPSRTRLLARLFVFGVEIALIQAILRRPLAVLFGGERSAAPIEAAVAATAVALLLALLVWIYQTARPMVQALTLRAIDAAIPTVGTPPSGAEITLPTSLTDEATLRSPLPRGADATLPSATDDHATLRSATAPDEATLRSPTSPDEATVRSPNTPDETVRSPRPP